MPDVANPTVASLVITIQSAVTAGLGYLYVYAIIYSSDGIDSK